MGRELEDVGIDDIGSIVGRSLRAEMFVDLQSPAEVSSEVGLDAVPGHIVNGGMFSSGTNVRCVSLSRMSVMLGPADDSGNGYDVGSVGKGRQLMSVGLADDSSGWWKCVCGWAPSVKCSNIFAVLQ